MNCNPVHLPEPVWDRDDFGTQILGTLGFIFFIAGLGGLLAVWGN